MSSLPSACATYAIGTYAEEHILDEFPVALNQKLPRMPCSLRIRPNYLKVTSVITREENHLMHVIW